MATEHFLVTGALGCIGAWVVRTLVKAGTPVTVLDVADDPRRMRLIMEPDEVAQVRFVVGDVVDGAFVERTLRDGGFTHLIHLAALQVPFCKADPARGALVNVLGTINLFEAAKRAGLPRLVYASSVAVYGAMDDYPELAPGHDLGPEVAPHPRTHYGVYKQANEGSARVYWLDDGVSSLGLRPHTLYGPGRDQGITSSPTKAMLAAAAGRPYHIPYGGRSDLQYTQDVAEIFVRAARHPFQGAEVFNLRGEIVDMRAVVACIEAAEPSARGRITFDPQPLPFPAGAPDGGIEALLGPLPHTPLEQGVAATLDTFRHNLAAGRLSAEG